MDESIISELSPKHNLILKWYKGEDLYSEGEVEDVITEMIASNPPEEYVDAIFDNYAWSTYYHLTHVRQNILNWYPFRTDADLLEIGCGMGAITGMLCDRVHSVTAVELSKKRATAAWLRCREKENLEIIVGNLNDIEFEKKYDYITLIGVLEYQGNYTDTENPYVDFLTKIRSLLKPDGRLFIAIENQYGLKYWCGAREDHTGISFDGINGYEKAKGVRTFSAHALDELVKRSGFNHTYFYYPMPDYKLPTVIYSQDKMPNNGNMQNMQVYYVPNDSTVIANEKRVWNDVVDNGVFGFFANSFLVECMIGEKKDEYGDERVTFATMSTARLPQYRIGTRFIGSKRVEKFLPALSYGTGHIDTILHNENVLTDNGINVLRGNRYDAGISYEFIVDELLETKLLHYIRSDEIDESIMLLDKVYDDIIASSPHSPSADNLIFTFGLNVPNDESLYGTILRTANLDMIFRNAFISEEGLLWFDQEWTLENMPASFVMFRAIREFWYSYPDIGNHLDIEKVMHRYKVANVYKTYTNVEKLFVGAVMDAKHMAEANGFAPRKNSFVQ